jgi:glycosyltransferase involved in cell wall biosynthesis
MSSQISPLLSVIVPVAMGREPYSRLFKWLPEIVLHDIEIILVLDEYYSLAEQNFLREINTYRSSKFTILQGKFGSPGGARNAGLQHATGKWVAFWDSDDTPSVTLFIQMINHAELEQSEVAIGSFKWRSDENSDEVNLFTNPLEVKDLITSVGITPGIWRFAILKNLIIHPFSHLRMAEDQDFILSNNLISRKLSISTDYVYEYFSGGANHQTSVPANFSDLHMALNFTYKNFYKLRGERSRQLATLFWVQQFGSNLKHGKNLTRVKIVLFAIRQFIFSNIAFKKLTISNFVRLLLFKRALTKTAKVIVALTGGLGNQLFQLSAALAIAEGAKVTLDSRIGAPRSNSEGKPDIASFELPKNVQFSNTNIRNKLIKKSSGYMLRMGVSPKKYEESCIYQNLFRFTWNLLMILSFRKILFSSAGVGVGYFPLKKLKTNQFIYGYFQSYKWPEKSFEQLRSIKPLVDSTDTLRYKELAQIEAPLVVHIRLGDYKLEKSFGIPNKNYYNEAISRLWETNEYKKIWVFSDEPEEASDFLPQKHLKNIRWIPEINSSPAHTLETMRFGHGFVIGNSTFSWWGAYLAYNSEARVVAPSPWFKLGESPQALIPPRWDQIDAFKD